MERGLFLELDGRRKLEFATPRALGRIGACEFPLEDPMSYYFSKILALPFDEAVMHVTRRLADKGFGVLTTIDVRATMRAKIGMDFKPYTILGACNPHFAWRALQAEEKIGTMLPCNVIVAEIEPGKVEVSAVDPVASMSAIDNPALGDLAVNVRDILAAVVRDL